MVPPNLQRPIETQAETLPRVGDYCDSIRDVLEASKYRFRDILGRKEGENRRLAVVVLTGWRDCLVSVSDDRRYYFCSVGSFTDLKKAEAEAAEIAADIGKNCLGSLWRVNPTTVPPNISSLRLVASGTEATVTIRPTKRLTSEIWDIHIEIEP
jgi:hypothetical protein